MPVKGMQKLYTRTIYLYKVYAKYEDDIFGESVYGWRARVRDGENGKLKDVPVYEDRYGKYMVLNHDKIYLRNFEMTNS